MSQEIAPIRSIGDLMNAVKAIRQRWNPDGHMDEEFWFRGHSDKSHELLPTIYRADAIKAEYPEREGTLTQVFQLRSRAHVAQLGQSPPTFREWYVEARHHGLPTRLLDWTESVLIALYFAIEPHWNAMSRNHWFNHRDRLAATSGIANPPCIWMLDAGTVNKLSQGHDSIYRLDTEDRCVSQYFVEQGALSRATNNQFPIAIYPPRVSPRITAQGGYFTLHGTARDSLETLAANHSAHLLLHRIDIDPNALPQMIDELVLCGISRATVYPDMDSVAAYVKWFYHA
jgi:hypothetical protein